MFRQGCVKSGTLEKQRTFATYESHWGIYVWVSAGIDAHVIVLFCINQHSRRGGPLTTSEEIQRHNKTVSFPWNLEGSLWKYTPLIGRGADAAGIKRKHSRLGASKMLHYAWSTAFGGGKFIAFGTTTAATRTPGTQCSL